MKKQHRVVALVAFFALLITGVSVAAYRKEAQLISVSAATYRVGSSGSTVKTIQQKLKNWGYYTGKVDGIYGSKTKSAVIKFQRKNNLVCIR